MKKYLVLCVLFIVGCTPVATQIAADGKVVGQAMLNMAAIIQVTNPTSAATLTTAANALEAATANWTTGSSLALVNDAAQVAEVALASIPQTTAVAPLVAVAVAALDIIIAEAGGTGATTPAIVHASRPVMVAAVNPYRGKYKIKHVPFRSPEGDFKAAWNSVANAHPSLSVAALK